MKIFTEGLNRPSVTLWRVLLEVKSLVVQIGCRSNFFNKFRGPEGDDGNSKYLYFVSYILKLNLREMLNFDCKGNECYIYIKHNDTKMPQEGIAYTDAREYIDQVYIQYILP